MKWQLIDTAPRDGTVLLLCGAGETEYEVATWWHETKCQCPGGAWVTEGGLIIWFEPTHWCELEPPAVRQPAGRAGWAAE